ncbi:PEP-CTERM sorting domain-containing protein [Phragmitibacter flavus]|uniref:PEP-CTERM sorting domain-containing protein n=1 Tax=Phragmitibacter flavus TaxID=2576071 RepID=A0A5R8KFS5_9BACT|nr:autotransporter-associated beta strand repeat-containing protein [Phragmitibacter flavus]TLD71136.1 PEP-CTERM sorting domain-containing protein [Phragmitibacter flavus]
MNSPRFVLTPALALVMLGCLTPALKAATFTWTDTTGGTKNWNDATAPTNVWGQPGTFPNAIDDIANVTANITAATLINLNVPITIGTLNIGDSGTTNAAYTIAAGTAGNLIFDVTAGNAAITQNSASFGDTISANITLNDNLLVTNNGATGAVASQRNLTISGNISTGIGTTEFAKAGGGTVILSGTNTYNGATRITAGALRVSSAASLSANSNLNLAGGILELNHTTAFTHGLGTGAGQVQFTATNSGFSAVNATRTVNIGGNVTPDTLTWASGGFIGTGQNLQFGSNTADQTVIFSNAIELAIGTSTAATRTVNLTAGLNATSEVRFTNVISNTTGTTGGTLTFQGGGHAELTAANTYDAATQVSGNSTLRITNLQNGGTASSLGASSNAANNLRLHGGFVEYNGATTPGSTDRNFSLNNAGGGISNTSATANTVTWTGSATMTATGNRTFTLGGNNTGNNTFSGGGLADAGGTTTLDKTGTGTWIVGGTNTNSVVRVREGTLAATGGTAISDTATVNVLGNTGVNATFRLDSSETIGALAGNGNVNVQGNTLTITTNANTAFNGSFASSAGGKIVKTGTGIMELGGTSTGVVSTEFQAGTVILRNPNALGATGSNARFGDGTTIQFDNQGFLSKRATNAALGNTALAPAIGQAGTFVSLRPDHAFTNDAVIFGENTAWLTTGIMVQASAAGSWTFGEHHDDAVRLYINGNTILNNGTWNNFTGVSGTVSNNNGVNTAVTTNTTVGVGTVIQFHLQNGGGGVGPVNANGINWTFNPTTNRFGIGYATTDLATGGALNTAQSAYTGFEETASTADTTRWKAYTNAVIANDFELAGAVTFDTEGMNADRVIVNGVVKNGTGNGETGSLIKTGANALELTNSNTYIGSTLINEGRLVASNTTGSATGFGQVLVEAAAGLAGNGRIETSAGNDIHLKAGAFLIVGDPFTDLSPDTLTFALGSGGEFLSDGIIQMQIGTDGLGAPNTNADKLVVNGAALLTGTLDVSTFIAGQIFAEGDTWDIFDWNGTVTGSFASIVLPSLTAYPLLAWNTSDLYNGGSISLSAVPEPTRALLLIAAVAAAFFNRRRSR